MIWKFRPLKLEDSDLIFQWRNHPEIYKHLFTPEPVQLEQHQRWIKKMLNSPDILFLIGQMDGIDVGTVRFSFNKDMSTAEVGIYLDPSYQGRGLGSEMLSAAELVVKEKIKTLNKLVARVVPENLASVRMFKTTGYSDQFLQLEKKFD